MKKILLASAAFIALTAGSFGMAATASAAPSGSSSPAQTIDDLRAKGYNVMVNGTRGASLANCSVDAVRGTSKEPPGATVYVDLFCPLAYQY